MEKGKRNVTVQVAWTESRNYSAAINAEVLENAQPHEIRALLEDADHWYDLVRKQHSEAKCLDNVEHRQALDYQIVNK